MNVDRKLQSMLRRDAESNYSSTVAVEYRRADDLAKESVSHAGKCEIIRTLSRRFDGPIMLLDLGCGTGRYFHCAENVQAVIGVDPSEHMLGQARKPVMGGKRRVHLVRSTLHEAAFVRESFHLAICVGVLGEWCRLDDAILRRVAGMLRKDGVFFCSVVEYQPAPVTSKRRIAAAIKPFLFGPARRYVDVRLRQFTMAEEQARDLGRAYFDQVQITKWESPTSRVDLHCVMAHPISSC
jgi:ubiquinone/menaquinone biosynthesis C-methylase UbiE